MTKSKPKTSLYSSEFYLDYAKEISVSLKSKGQKVVPQLTYHGIDKVSGANIISDLQKIITIEKDEDGKYSLYLKHLKAKERFARYEFDKQQGIFYKDKEYTTRYLTAFELRLLARDGEMLSVYSRDDVADLTHKTDLHTHFAGCLSPKDLIEVGLKHHIGIPAFLLKKEGIDISKYAKDTNCCVLLKDIVADRKDFELFTSALRIPVEQQETFNRMEEIYDLRDVFVKNKKLFSDLLYKIAQSHANAGIKYAEFSLVSVLKDPEVLSVLYKEIPEIEKKTGCKMRFLAGISRHLTKDLMQDRADCVKTIASHPYIVGVDFIGHETNPTSSFGEELKELAKWTAINDPDFVIRVHAGENPIFQDNVKETLKIIKKAVKEAEQEQGKKLKYPVVRIGHGLYGVDEECIKLCKEMDAVIEFNMASNLSLNNIDDIKDVPIEKYAKAGVRFVLGSDGMGLYSTSPAQDIILAHAAGVSREEIKAMNRIEDDLIKKADSVFKNKDKKLTKRMMKGETLKDIFTYKYNTENNQPRYDKERMLIEEEMKHARLQAFLDKEIARIGAETNENKVEAVMKDKMPILITGASVKAWASISPKDQEEIKLAFEALVNILDPDKACIITGGTNHGVEKVMHEVAHQRNVNKEKPLAVIGTLTEEAAYKERASIEENTITHAIILKLEGKIAEKWFDLPDAVLNKIAEQKGEVIAVGGGSIVRDMIQRAYNLHIGINLMDGPDGASTAKAMVMPEHAFKGAKGLIERLYKKHPEIFVKDFHIEDLNKYITKIKRKHKSCQPVVKKISNEK